MIKTLIVDDETLVRKGLIMTMPWQKFDIEIVGEASSGLRALEFVREKKVDLLITDITMPNMSGFELIETLKREFPDMFIVVITCHQDFDYIQKALRMGAIDYIVKTQIEDAEIEESLKRITEHIELIKKNKQKVSKDKRKLSETTTGILLVAKVNVLNNDEINHLIMLKEEERIDMGNGIILYLMDDGKVSLYEDYFLTGSLFEHWIITKFTNMQHVDRAILVNFTMGYINNTLFYQYNSLDKLIVEDATDNKSFNRAFENEKFLQLKKEWSSIIWLSNNTEFDRLKTVTLELRPDINRLKSLFYKVAAEWKSSLIIFLPEGYLDILESARFWVDYEKWLSETRHFIRSKINLTSYHEETVNIIMQSFDYIRQNLTKDINQESIAKRFNLSRSYFSKVFRDIAGMNFVDYMRNLRLKEAKKMLIQSNTLVYEIAENLGFLDEKYFSRIFKERVGMTPIEYRNKNK